MHLILTTPALIGLLELEAVEDEPIRDIDPLEMNLFHDKF